MSEQKTPPPFVPDTDEEIRKRATITLADIADAIADLRRLLPDIAEGILNGNNQRPADKAR